MDGHRCRNSYYELTFAIAVLAAVGSLENIAGALGDVLGAIATVLIIPMFIASDKIVMINHETLGRLLQILGVLGVLSWLIAFFFITFSHEPDEVWVLSAEDSSG
jgi:hypothetical protein